MEGHQASVEEIERERMAYHLIRRGGQFWGRGGERSDFSDSSLSSVSEVIKSSDPDPISNHLCFWVRVLFMMLSNKWVLISKLTMKGFLTNVISYPIQQPNCLCIYRSKKGSVASVATSRVFPRPKFAIGPKRFQSHQPEIIPAETLPLLPARARPEWENFAV